MLCFRCFRNPYDVVFIGFVSSAGQCINETEDLLGKSLFFKVLQGIGAVLDNVVQYRRSSLYFSVYLLHYIQGMQYIRFSIALNLPFMGLQGDGDGFSQAIHISSLLKNGVNIKIISSIGTK
jgi:hypothetical protein